MSRNATDLEQEVAELRAAVRCFTEVLTQPGIVTAPWFRTVTGPGGKVGVPELFPALRPFAGPNGRGGT